MLSLFVLLLLLLLLLLQVLPKLLVLRLQFTYGRSNLMLGFKSELLQVRVKLRILLCNLRLRRG